jgi:hypothetical protein
MGPTGSGSDRPRPQLVVLTNVTHPAPLAVVGAYTPSGRLSKFKFPSPNSTVNPRLWCSRREKYFDMCGIDESLWIRVAKMHFDVPATRWLQPLESQLPNCSSLSFCRLHDHFDHGQYEFLIRQLFNAAIQAPVIRFVMSDCQRNLRSRLSLLFMT